MFDRFLSSFFWRILHSPKWSVHKNIHFELWAAVFPEKMFRHLREQPWWGQFLVNLRAAELYPRSARLLSQAWGLSLRYHWRVLAIFDFAALNGANNLDFQKSKSRVAFHSNFWALLVWLHWWNVNCGSLRVLICHFTVGKSWSSFKNGRWRC